MLKYLAIPIGLFFIWTAFLPPHELLYDVWFFVIGLAFLGVFFIARREEKRKKDEIPHS